RLALLRRQLLQRGDDAADRDDLAVAAPLELVQRAVGPAAQLVADRRERMLGDVQPERLLLEAQELRLLELGDRRNRRMVPRRRVAAELPEVEDRPLAEQPVRLLALAPGERLLEAVEQPAARGAGRVEAAALDERLERALVHDLRVDALGEVPDRG